ncbi:hypothetical protein BJ138DRAFT_45042 [Hygrophoropsis aurantiaca]|uniref:Uncharacterized protein n=1 Tax=Hygrophoropsis aurantiaca TaxID=72124 RepID=A0ACB7ZT06_9AGAM|nr:hypothetical protein BJ138DRAFT_45042 [Hygrophoropsis aurantiaca]
MEKIYITSTPRRSAPTGTQKFYVALASSLSRESIREIAITDESRASASDLAASYPLGIHELRPLLRFDGLQYLNLSVQRSIVFDDAMLLALADAWPHILVLNLNNYGHRHSSSGVTPLAFITLLARCPKLKQLRIIPLDFSTIDSQTADFDPLSIDALRIQGRKGALAELTELWLDSYRIVYPDAVAKFLSAVLPNLAGIYMFNSKSGMPASHGDAVACRQSFYKTT